jgi:hypothetical protein
MTTSRVSRLRGSRADLDNEEEALKSDCASLTSKRILLIAYNFPPLMSPQSLRWFYLSRELSKMGFRIEVLTIRMPANFNDLLDEIPADITIHRTFPGPFYHVTFKHSREAEEKNIPHTTQRPSFLRRIIFFAYFKTYRALNSLPMPDIYTEWLPFAVSKGLRLLKTKRYDLIVSSSEQRICHLIGYLLKKRSGVSWMADYGDPWIYPVPTVKEARWKRKTLSEIERTLVKKMDAITVASEGIKSLYLERYPFLKEEKIRVVTQGFDPVMFSWVEGEFSPGFRIVYCGSFYRDLRDPTPFFEAVRDIDADDMEVVIAGRINEFVTVLEEEGLRRRITYRGFLDHRKSMSLEKGATVLLHIGNATDIQVPGKIYEYFGAGRPVLCIRGGRRDPSAELVGRYNRGIVVENNKGEIKEGIHQLHELWRTAKLDDHFSLGMSPEFTWRKGADIIKNIVENL